MNETNKLFYNKKLSLPKLLSFGFEEKAGKYIYSTTIIDGQFKMFVEITTTDTISTRLIDIASNEEYILHRTTNATGIFVGSVRSTHQAILQEIAEKCFEVDIFKSDDAKKVVQYVYDTYNDQPEFLWAKSPENAILRRKNTGKWYGALLVLSKRKLGFDSDEIINILNVRTKLQSAQTLIDYKNYYPAYHMNKNNWVTICLDGTVPTQEIFRRIDNSYKLAVK